MDVKVDLGSLEASAVDGGVSGLYFSISRALRSPTPRISEMKSGDRCSIELICNNKIRMGCSEVQRKLDNWRYIPGGKL